MPGRRRYTAHRSPTTRTEMWNAKVDADTYSRYLRATKPLAMPRVAEYQTAHEVLISTVKNVLDRIGKTYETHQYMWYASKLYKLINTYTGEALNKEATIAFLEYLIRGLDEGALRAIAAALGIKISPLADILERRLAPLLLKIIAQGSVIADGTEQTILEYAGNIALISGYIDLSNMAFGDRVVISSYVKLTPGSDYILYRSEEYYGQQAEPALYIQPRLSGAALKVTLKQTAGTYKTFTYLFTKGV